MVLPFIATDVCGVGVIDDGELSPSLEAFESAGFDGFVVSVVDDGDGLRGEDGAWDWLSLCEPRGSLFLESAPLSGSPDKISD